MLLAAALSISLQLVRTSFDMLDAVSVEVVVHNDTKHPISATFAQPAEYELDLVKGDELLWTTLTPPAPNAHFPPHTRVFLPGPTVLTVYVWNGLTKDGSVPAAGTYEWRSKLLDSSPPAPAKAAVHFIASVPVSALGKLKPDEVVTISGTLDAAKSTVTDATGSIDLAKKLLTAPSGPVAIRGFLSTKPDRTPAFFVQRWAPIAGTEKLSVPVSSPSPPIRRL